MPPTERFIEAKGQRLHVLEWGSAADPPVVVLHGLNSHGWDWDFLAKPLAQTHRVLCLDLRGHGQSSWAADYTAPRFYEDIEALLDFYGYGAVTLFGYSVGGAIAYAFAGTYPERVGRLVVVDNAPERGRSMTPEMASALAELRDAETFASVDEAVALWRRIDPRGDTERVRHSLKHNLTLSDHGRWEPRDHNVSRSNSGFAPATLYQPPVEERWRLLAQITCPTLIVHAEHSEQFNEDVMRRMTAALRDGQYVQIPDSGHRVHWDNPARLLQVVLPFLRS